VKFRALAATTALAVTLSGAVAVETEAATIFVNTDEWTLTGTGVDNAPAGSVANFVANLVAEMGPKIHAYSTNFGFTDTAVVNAMASAGANYTTGTVGFDFSLVNLSLYDALFLGGFYLSAAEVDTLSAFVAGGGNVYIAGGTGVGGPADEAAAWNSFLSPFGVQMEPNYSISGTIPVSGDPLFDGVSGLYSNGGNPLTGTSVFCCGETVGGRYAVYRTDDNGNGPGPNPIPLPAAGWIMLSGLMSFAAVRRRRRS
jgi:hypothetical protein